MRLAYVIAGAVERSDSAQGRALAAATNLTVRTVPRPRSDVRVVRAPQVLSLACTPSLYAVPAPCGTRMRPDAWRVQLDRDEGVRAQILKAIERFREAGARIVRLDDVDLLSRHAVATYYLVATSEASANLARFDGMRYGPREPADDLFDAYARTRGRRLGEEVKRRILLGTFALSRGYYDAYYKKAQQVRRLVQDAFARAFASATMKLSSCSSSFATRCCLIELM